MAPTGFGPYNGLWLEDAATKCIGVTPTQWAMTHALGCPIPSKSQVVGSVIRGEKMLPFGVRTNRSAGWILTERGGVDA